MGALETRGNGKRTRPIFRYSFPVSESVMVGIVVLVVLLAVGVALAVAMKQRRQAKLDSQKDASELALEVRRLDIFTCCQLDTLTHPFTSPLAL